ncbi:MAG: cobalt ECF transporter T component CbiQ [Bacillota bacterium]
MWLDKYNNLETVIHNWEPRVKLIGITTLIFTFAFINKLYLAPFIVLISFIIYLFAKLPVGFLLKRLRLPGFFLIIMLVLMIFVSKGTVLFTIGPLSVKKEGLLTAVLVGARFLSILTLVIVLFGTSSFTENIKAMRSLGLPVIFADIMTFTYRYFFEISNYLKTMSHAMTLRGFKAKSFKDLAILASMVGTMFIRSFDQSERVFSAMAIRGYGQARGFKYHTKIYPKDLFITAVFIAISLGLLLAQSYLNAHTINF